MTRPAKQEEMRICIKCGVERPLSEFRRRRSGTEHRHHDCRRCFNEYARERRATRRRKLIGQGVREIKNPRTSPRKVKLVLAAMMRQFGGLSGFVTTWKEQFDHAAATKPASKGVWDSIRAINRMAEIADEYQRRWDVSDLSDEELAEALAGVVHEEVHATIVHLIDSGEIILVSK